MLLGDWRRRHRADVDAVPVGRHRSDSAQGAGDDRHRLCGDARRGGAGRAGVPHGRPAGTRHIEPGDAKGQVRVLRGATVLDGLGGRIVNARVVIRDHRIAEVSLDDERVPLPEGAAVEDAQRPLSDPWAVRFARALGRLGRHRRGADRAHRRSDGARLRRDARGRRDLGRVAHRRPRRHAERCRPPSRRPSSARRERSSPDRLSPPRAGIRRRCSRSCRDWPNS